MCRGLVGYIYQDKVSLSYNEDGSEPDELGEDVLDLIVRINKENGWEIFKTNSLKIKDKNDSITDLFGSEWLNELYSGNLEYWSFDNEFIKESLYCEYVYIINLDTMNFEFYIGFQQKPQIGNRFGTIEKDGYYPCKLSLIINIKDIVDTIDLKNLVDKMIKIDETGQDDNSVINLFRKPKLDAINKESLKIKTCFSGGARGSDSIFEFEAIKRGFNVVSYSFEGHNTSSKNRLNLSPNQLKEGFEHIKKTNERLNRNIKNLTPYVKNLISRDWFQVNSSDTIFAIGNLDGVDNVKGGTGYAVSCAIDNNKPIYLFEQNDNQWYYYDYETNRFEIYEKIPILTSKFAGIGTRQINENGLNAIIKLFEES